VEQELPQDLEGDNTKSQETKRVLATHTVKKGEDEVSKMLIQSKGKVVEEATWDEACNIQSQHPGFRFEDKLAVPGGRNDSPRC